MKILFLFIFIFLSLSCFQQKMVLTKSIEALNLILNNQNITEIGSKLNSSCDPVKIEGNGTQDIYSGYLNVNKSKSNSSLFYIFYGARNRNNRKLEDIPVLIWVSATKQSYLLTNNIKMNTIHFLNSFYFKFSLFSA